MSNTLRGTLAGLAVATLIASLAACSSSAEAPAETSTALTIAVDPVDFMGGGNWDPIQGGSGGRFASTVVYDVLAIWNPEAQEFTPQLAEELTFSEDRQTLTLKLREGVTFVDGEPLNAAGVADYFNALVASEKYIQRGDMIPYETAFKAIGEYTVEISTSKPIFGPDFWYLLGTVGVLGPAALDDPDEARSQPLGSGPYVLEESITDVEMTFTKNSAHWNSAAFPWDTVTVKVIADPVSRLNALKSGQVDAAPIGLDYVAEAEASGLSLHEAPGYGRNIWFPDVENSIIPALRDVRVRQAMNYAFDREAINESIDHGRGRVSSQEFNPGQPEYVEGGDDRYEYDPDRARQLMAEAGYADGFDLAIPTYPDHAPIEPIVRQALGDIGIRVTYDQFPDRTEWIKAITSGTYGLTLEALRSRVLALRGLTIDYPGFGRLFAQNAGIDAFIARIKGVDPADSARASQELGTMLLEEAWYVPISRPPLVWATIPSLDMTTNPTYLTLPDWVTLRELTTAD